MAQRSTLNAQRSTLNAQRSTLNAQRLLCLMALIASSLFVASGCPEHPYSALNDSDSGGNARRGSGENRYTVDVGVVLAGREGYFCLPFERLGLRSDEVVLAVGTSCPCLRPSLIEYLVHDGSRKPGILVEYDESEGEWRLDQSLDVKPLATNLQVAITLDLLGGRREFAVQLLHTSLAEPNQGR